MEIDSSFENARRVKGQGTLQVYPNGKARFGFTVDGKKRWSQMFNSKEMAEGVLHASLMELTKTEQKPHPQMTLREWGALWLQKRKNRDVNNDQSRWKNHIETAPFIETRLQAITRLDIKQWLDIICYKQALVSVPGGGKALSEKTIGLQTRKHILNLLRKCLSDAVDAEILDVNVAQNIQVPKNEDDTDLDEAWTYLELGEIEKLLHCPKIPEEKRIAFQFAIYSGLRQGEIWGLLWEDVHLNCPNPYLDVKRSYDGQVKTRTSRRRIPLIKPSLDALLHLKTLQKAAASPWVFPNEKGEMYGDGYDAGWADRSGTDSEGQPKRRPGLKTKSGIERAVRFHDLRHTCASHLVMGSWGMKWSMEEIRDFLGHASIETTQRYAHLSPEHLSKKAAQTGFTSSNLVQMGPKSVQTETSQEPTDRRWALLESNQRPSASETGALSN